MMNDNKIVSNEKIALNLLNDMEDNITMIKKVLDLDMDNLTKLLDKLSSNDKDNIMEIIINKQLKKLKSISKEQYYNLRKDVDEITDYYTSKKEDFDIVIEDGDYIADQLLLKVIDENLELPIDICMIKKYSFSSKLKEEQFYDTLIWIALRYIAISKCIV